MDPALRTALDEFAAHPVVVIGVDFDGTLAPLADNPMDAEPVAGAMPLLTELAARPGVTVAVVSGRALGALHTLTQATDPMVLIGSHGAESSLADAGHRLSEEEHGRLSALDEDLDALLDEHPEARLERKPSAVVLHTRGMEQDAAVAATEAGAQVAARHTGVSTTPGKDVLEMAVTEAGKGPALLELADSVGADIILYAGDDVTDERAFEALRSSDLTVKVGDGPTAAHHRVPDEWAVVRILQHLVDTRRDEP